MLSSGGAGGGRARPCADCSFDHWQVYGGGGSGGGEEVYGGGGGGGGGIGKPPASSMHAREPLWAVGGAGPTPSELLLWARE